MDRLVCRFGRVLTMIYNGHRYRSILTLMVALGVDAIWSNTNQNGCSGQGTRENHFTVAEIMLSLMICLAAMRFGFFMLHLRRISQALGRSELSA